MKKNKYSTKSKITVCVIIISLITIFISASLININGTDLTSNYLHLDKNELNPKSADNGLKSLNYSSIYQSTFSPINRLFDSIYFRVNVSGFLNANYTFMQISYQNNAFKNFSMSKLNDDEFEYNYTPEYNAPLGFHRVNFYIFNQSDYLLNAHTTYVNFTIISNYLGCLNEPDYERGDLAWGEFQIVDFGLHNFTWVLSLTDNLNESLETVFFTLGTDIESFYFELNESFTFSNHMYYVKIKINDTYYNKISRIYLPFKLLNSIPEIVSGSVNFSSTTIKIAEECTISLNVTDGDMGIDTFAENISVLITIQDSEGSETTPTSMTNNGDWTFVYTFSVAIGKPIGTYQVIFTVFDQFILLSEPYIEIIQVENNNPEIHGFTINGIDVENSISINYGEDIIFKFNVSDVEDRISLITVHLLNEMNEWYNLSIKYEDNVELVIRTIDLMPGSWYVYLTVYDSDGGVTSLTSDYGFAPKEIRIIPDLLSPALPWIALIIGLIIGFLGGLALVYRYFKSKYSEPQEAISKKKKVKKQKVKKQPEEEETPEKIDEKEPKKEPSEQKPVQRKIKRRLK